MARSRRAVLAAVATSLILVPAAQAGTVSVERSAEDTRIVFRAAPGEANDLRYAPAEEGVRIADAVPLVAGPGCAPAADGLSATCDATDVAWVTADLGDGADSASGGDLELRLHIEGGADADQLTGGGHRDVLAGGDGDDRLMGAHGFDELRGGAGYDTADFAARAAGVCVALSLGDFSCYMQPEGHYADPGVERILLGDGADRVDGSRGNPPAEVHGGAGDDHLTASGGGGRVYAGPGDDRVNALVGFPTPPAEHIECGTGADTASAWWNAHIADDCETAHFPSVVSYELPPVELSERAEREMSSWWFNPATWTVPPPRAAGEPEGYWEARRKAYLESLGGKSLAAEVPTRSLGVLGGKGLPVDVRCATACAFKARLSVSRATARRHGLRGTVIARTSASRRQADHARIRLRPAAAARRRLARTSRLTITLRVTANERAGGPRTDQRRLTLKR